MLTVQQSVNCDEMLPVKQIVGLPITVSKWDCFILSIRDKHRLDSQMENLDFFGQSYDFISTFIAVVSLNKTLYPILKLTLKLVIYDCSIASYLDDLKTTTS